MKKIFVTMLLTILIVWICMVNAVAVEIDPIYEISLQTMTIQSTTNLLGTFVDAAVVPDNSIQIQSSGAPPPLYFQVKLNISQTDNVFTLTPSVYLSFQASGPYQFLGDLDGISITNPAPTTLFFRNSFNPIDTNIFYVDPYTFKWVAPSP